MGNFIIYIRLISRLMHQSYVVNPVLFFLWYNGKKTTDLINLVTIVYSILFHHTFWTDSNWIVAKWFHDALHDT